LACSRVRSWRLHGWGQAEGGAGRIRHVQPVGDPLEYLQSGDALTVPHDVADLALCHATGDGQLGLTGSGVLADQLEHPAHVAVAQSLGHRGPLPERGWDLDQIGGSSGHAVGSSVASGCARA